MHRKCAIPDCSLAVKPGKPVCHRHIRTSEGRELMAQLRALAQILAPPTQIQPDAPLSNTSTITNPGNVTRKMRQKIERGDLHPLLKSPLAQLAEQNALEKEIDAGIAANRIGIYRLLDDMPDAATMATGIARLTDSTSDLLRLRLKNRRPRPQ